MDSAWPWLTVAGLGALHGLNPASGWLWAAAWGVRSGDRSQALRALWPIALGHVASVAMVAGAVVYGLAMNHGGLQIAVWGLLVAAVAVHLSGHAPQAMRAPAGHAGLALCSFLVSTAHGAGLMLVPALVPLCMGDGSAQAFSAADSLALAFAAVAVHSVAMLATTGVVATGICRGFDAAVR